MFPSHDNSSDPTLKKKYQKEADDINAKKEAVLSGKPEDKVKENRIIKEVKEFYDENLLPKSDKMLLESKKENEQNPKFDETKVKDFLEYVAQQANNIRSDKTFDTSTDAREAAKAHYSSHLIDLANEMFPEYKSIADEHDFSAAQPKLEPQTKETKSAISLTPEIVEPSTEYRTMEMGTDEGKPETREAREQMKDRFLKGNVPIDGEGGSGETGRDFVARTISQWDKDKNEQPNNTTIVTHSSVLKTIKAWENPETWKGIEKPADPKNMTPEQWEAFAKEYNKESTDNGDIETFKGKNGDIHIVRHGQTEDNAEHNFRSAETNLTEKGIQQGREAANKLMEKTGGEIPKILSSSLPRAIHTSDIIRETLNQKKNAIQEPGASRILQHPLS